MNLTEIGWKVSDYIHPVQDKDQWRVPVDTVINLRVPQRAANFLTS